MSEEAKVSNVSTLIREESEKDYMDMDVFLGLKNEDNGKVSPVTLVKSLTEVGENSHVSPVTLEKSLTEIAEITHGYIIKSTLMGAFALERMMSQELWKSLGYETADKYLSYGLPFSRRTAYRYLQIAQKLQETGYINQLSPSEIKNNIGIDDPDIGEGLVVCPIPEIQEFLELGISKFLILANQAPWYFDLYKNGILEDKSTDLRVAGKEYSFLELKEMSKSEFSKIFDIETPTLTKPQLKDQVEMLQDHLKQLRNRSLKVAKIVTKSDHTLEIDEAIKTINDKFNFLMTLLERAS